MAQKDIILRLKVEGAENTERLLSDVTKEVDRLEKELTQAERRTDRFIAAQKRLAQTQNALKQRGSEFSGQLRRVNALQTQTARNARTATRATGQFSGAMSLATKAGAAFVALGIASEIANIAKQSIEAAGNYENLTIAFDTFLGGADKAALVLQELNRFSVETPFTPEQVNLASKALLGQGVTIQDTTRLLRNLGNISAGVGTNFNELVDIVARARSQGRLFQEDINQFTGRGIPILGELAKVLGKSEGELRKMTETGQVTFAVLDKALQNLTSETGRFGGLIERQSKTLPGLLSTLEGSWNNLLRTLGEGKPLEAAKSGLSGIIDLVNTLTEKLDPDKVKVSEAVKEIKKELSLEGISNLTQNELAQRGEQLRQALYKEQQALNFALANERFQVERLEKAKREYRKQTSLLTGAESDKAREAAKKEFRASMDAIELAETEARTQRARVAAIQNALDDIAKIEDKAVKDNESRRASERPDILKLEILRIELANKTANKLADYQTKIRKDSSETIETIIANEKRLAALRLELANLSAKNQAQRAANALKTEDALNTATEAAQLKQKKNATAIGAQTLENKKTAEEYTDEILLANDATQELAKSTLEIGDGFTDAEVKLAGALDSLKDLSRDFVTDVLPEIFNVFQTINNQQAESLDRSISLQEKRVKQAQELADKGNAEALERERAQLNEQLRQRAIVAEKQNRIAQLQTRLQIGLAAANAAAQSFGLPVAGQLAAAGAVAFGLPAIINAIPLFEDGGEVGGKPHKQGGTMINAEKGEYVVNKKSYAAFGPAVQAINSRKASPELMNAAASGNVGQFFALHTKPLEDRLMSVEKAIYAIPQTSFSLDDRGLTKRVSSIQRRAGRV